MATSRDHHRTASRFRLISTLPTDCCDNIQCNNYFASEKDVVDSVQKDETL